MNTMSYNGYQAHIEYDEADQLFIGRVSGIDDVVGFHGQTVTELREAFQEAVDDYAATRAGLGGPLSTQPSGSLHIELSPDDQAEMARAAKSTGRSTSEWAKHVLREAVKRGFQLV